MKHNNYGSDACRFSQKGVRPMERDSGKVPQALTDAQLTEILWRDGYHAAARMVERLKGAINREAEFKYLEAFAKQSDFGEQLYQEQFRALWTAYCFHHCLDVDTAEYDENLARLWNLLSAVEVETSGWSDYESFDNFMCRYLV